MAYATLAELKEHLGETALYPQLTDREAATTADDDVGQRALNAADGRINAYLSIRYAVPIEAGDAETDSLLKGVSLTLAEYALWQSSNMRTDTPDRVKDGYDENIDLLKAIAAGKAALPSAAPLASVATGISGSSGGYAQKFTESVIEDW